MARRHHVLTSVTAGWVWNGVLRSMLSLVAVVLAMGSVVLAQTSGSATLRGLVRDSSGAVVAKSTVTMTSESNKVQRETVTNDDGLYQFSAVVPGKYTVKCEKDGFKTVEQHDVTITTSDTRGVDFSLEAGIKGEIVTVEAGGDVIQKETGAKENTINAKQIENLSIISRSALELLRILPGVTAPFSDEPGQQSITFGGGANANNQYHVNGLRGEYNNVSIDGSRVMDIGSNNGTIITANVDMIQEVKVQSSNYAAEHGSSGVQITATTKGGGNDFHGSLYYYMRDTHLNANDRSNTILNVPRAGETYKYPGGNIGGPVLLPWTKFNRSRDKLFFFYGLEIQRQVVDGGTRFATVPTAEQRQGLFRGGNADGSDLDVRNRIDPIGQKLINLYPLPNHVDPVNPKINYASGAVLPRNRNQQNLRTDYNISNATKLYVRLAREYEADSNARGIWWGPSDVALPSAVVGTNTGKSGVANLTSIINPTMTNEIVFSLSKLGLNYGYEDPSKVSLAALGLQDLKGPYGKQSDFVPLGFIAWGSQGIVGNLWAQAGLPLFAHNSSLSFTDNLTKVSGVHTFKFGGLVERANKIQNLQHDTQMRAEITEWTPNATIQPFANLLIGRPASIEQGTTVPTGNFRLWNYEFYAQDGWKVRPNLTFEYGLRVDYYPTNYETEGLGVLFDPNTYVKGQGIFVNGDPQHPNGFLLASRGEIPKGVTKNPRPQFAPRLNFAWDISGKGDTVIRGGAGLFYNRVQGNYQYYSITQPPNSFPDTTFSAGAFTSLGGGTGLTWQTARLINPFQQIGSLNIQSANPDSINIPRIANMSLSIAHRLPGGNLFEVSYVGTQARHLPNSINSNFIPLGKLLSGRVGNADLSDPVQRIAVAGQASVLSQFRPFPAYGTVNLFEYNSTSSYHSLQATLSHQSGKRLQYFATYTFSKALGTTGVNETDGNGIDPIDTRHRNWGVLPFDRTHVFNVSYNYNVPDMARGGFRNWFSNALLNGWQMSGITTFASGVPIKLKFGGLLSSATYAAAYFGTDAFGAQGASSGAIAPILASNPQVNGGTTLGSKAFDINAIKIPGLGQTGDQVSPFYIRYPHRWNHDVSFFKNFQINERQKLQFRTGLFNIFNQAYARDTGAQDINTTLNVICGPGNTPVNGVPNGAGGTTDNICDPRKGLAFDPATIANFGRVNVKRGHRIVEFALKYSF